MSNRDPDVSYRTLPESVPFMIDQSVKAMVHTALPGIVQSYDASTERVSVQPAVRNMVAGEDGQLEPMDRPPIVDVPVAWPGSRAWKISWPLERGDDVLLVVCERSLDAWKDRPGELGNPVLGRFWSWQDAMAWPLARPSVARSVDGLAIQSADGTMAIEMAGGTVTIRGRVVIEHGPHRTVFPAA